MTRSAIELSNMDFSVQPGESFFHYVNGGWLSQNEIPGERASWGASSELDKSNNENLKVLFEELLKDEPGSSLLAELYVSGMDEAQVEENGLKPIKDSLDRIEACSSLEEFSELVAEIQIVGVGYSARPLWFPFPQPDSKKSTWNVLAIYQSGLGLPSREFYLEESKKDVCQKYRQHIKNMFILSGQAEETAELNANAVFEFEKKVAELSSKPEDLRDSQKTYNKISVEKLTELSSFPWGSYLKALGVEDAGDLIVDSLEFHENLGALLNQTELSVLKSYLLNFFLASAAPFLNKALVDEHFDFRSKTLNGIAEQKPRWESVMSNVSSVLEDLVSEMYVTKFFPPEAKESALELIQFIIKAFEIKIKELKWMKEETKQKALLKLSKFTVKVGYPDTWMDYSPLNGKVSRSNSYFENFQIASKYKYKTVFERVNKPVDKSIWFMPAYIINAYYMPTNNEIVFPAAILQPPFFYPPTKEEPYRFAPMNFGGIGSVIAHELSHGYDDQGRQYDQEGNLADWWLPEDAEEFGLRAEKIINQFDEFEIAGGKVNGKLTQGENIADLGGIVLSYTGYQEFLKQHGDKVPIHPKFTLNQQFFIAHAQIWRIKMKDSLMQQRLLNDPHSPGVFRVNGILANVPEFHEAFNIKEGERLFRPEELRAKIW
ncbi:hypothetical protein BC833DRAFT_566297 [Globomyces pollinis-pini]|nr:hypothetical protein BC833DRAFT_566297 [Globomyces pollinis-pini]